MKKILAGALILFAILISCSKTKTGSECNVNYDPCAFKAPQVEIDSVRSYLVAQGVSDTVLHCSGMFYKIDTLGTGKKAQPCSNITVYYRGRLTNGNVFAPYGTLQNVLNNFIAGFRNGIPLINEGGYMHLYIPPSLAYGNQANPGIPANSILIFDIKLVAVQ